MDSGCHKLAENIGVFWSITSSSGENVGELYKVDKLDDKAKIPYSAIELDTLIKIGLS